MQPDHLFTSDSDGALYDTRIPNWHKQPPLRRTFARTYANIKNNAQFKATLRAGAYSWPGAYPMYFICDDGESLCFTCARKELRNILSSTGHDVWHVVACDINYEDSTLTCTHCGEQIESAYGNDVNLDAMDISDLDEFANTSTDAELIEYAETKIEAMRARLDGRINHALALEAKCADLYEQLPTHLRW